MKYFRPKDLAEALAFLAGNGRETQIIAGGTDVMVDLREGTLTDKTRLMDVGRLEAIKGIEYDGHTVSIGAGTTLTELFHSEIIHTHVPALKKCATTFASEQIRNKATIGGNIAHASPCGDTIPPLIIHDAQCLVASAQEERLVPVQQIAHGPYRSALPADAMIVRFILTPGSGSFSDFQKIGRRKELAIARLSLAVNADMDDTGVVSFFRIGLGACTPTPHTMTEVENYLTGKPLTLANIWETGRLLSQKMIDITGRRASTIYKEPAVQGLFTRMMHPWLMQRERGQQ